MAALLEFLWALYEGLSDVAFETTLPVTQYLLSRKPLPPKGLEVLELTSKGAVVKVARELSTRFNVETHEVQIKADEADSDDKGSPSSWETAHDGEGRFPTLGGLEPFSEYHLRARSRNFWGTSEWSPELRVQTLMEPSGGGGSGPGYVWQQTGSEVVMDFPIKGMTDLRPKQVKIELRNRQQGLSVAVTPRQQGQQGREAEEEGLVILAEGELAGRVKPFADGSFWELSRDESGENHLVVTLEKCDPIKERNFSQPNRKAIWPCVIKGHPEIDVDLVAEL